MPSCTCRDGVTVRVIRPAVGVRVVAFDQSDAAGTAKFARLKMLNACACTSIRRCPVRVKTLASDQSLVKRPGPRSARDGTFPRYPRSFSTKQFTSKYAFTPPRIAFPAVQPGDQFGRSPSATAPTFWRERLKPVVTLNGYPL